MNRLWKKRQLGAFSFGNYRFLPLWKVFTPVVRVTSIPCYVCNLSASKAKRQMQAYWSGLSGACRS